MTSERRRREASGEWAEEPEAPAARPAPPVPSVGNQALARLLSGAAAPQAIPHDHPDEVAAHALAREVMRMAAPAGQRAAGRAALGGGIDDRTREFFEPRFGADLSAVRVHSGPAAADSAARHGAAAYTLGNDIVLGAGQQAGPNLVTAHELAHVVRGDAVGRMARAPGEQAAYAIISQVWQVAGRDIVVVAAGDQVLFFYRRTGLGNKGAGVAPAAGKWTPFKTLMEHRELPGQPWFNKNPYYRNVGPENELRGYGNTRNQQIGAWLDGQEVPAGTPADDWQVVEREMDEVAARHRASRPGGGSGGGRPGGGGPSEGGPGDGGSGGRSGENAAKAEGAEARAAGTEAKAAGTEAHAAGAEAKALGAEAKALRAEGAALEVAADAVKAGRVARLGALLLELALPGPWDVFFLYLSAFASIAEAKAKLRADSYALGFAEGLSAVLTGTSAARATQLLMYRVATPSIGERVAGFEGVRERGTNEGVAAGFKFGQALSAEQSTGFRTVCFRQMKANGQQLTGDFGRDDLIAMAVALRPTVVELLDEAQRQEEARQARERRQRRDWVGNKV